MKLCKDCKWFAPERIYHVEDPSTNRTLYTHKTEPTCLNPKTFSMDPVMGKHKPRICLLTRRPGFFQEHSGPEPCGPNGNLFEIKGQP